MNKKWLVGIFLAILGSSCADKQEENASTSDLPAPLNGYPVSPVGSSFNQEFDAASLDTTLFEVRDGYKIWDSWYDLTKVMTSEGMLLLSSDASDGHEGWVKVGGINTIAFYPYGKLEFRARTNASQGMIGSIYFYSEDRDRSSGGTHEEIDVELSSLHTGKASLVTYHGDALNWNILSTQSIKNHLPRPRTLPSNTGLFIGYPNGYTRG